MESLDCYRRVEVQDDLSSFVIKHSPLIKRVAAHIKCRLPACVELDDLIQAGLIGLLEAKNQFSETGGASFETYARIKIHGAMIDELRRHTGMTRDISQNMKNISAARTELENDEQYETPISGKNIAEKLGIPEKKYAHMMTEIHAWQSVSMNEVEKIDDVVCSLSPNPIDAVEKEDLRYAIKSVIASLPRREQQILALYYNEQLNFREIAEILDLTEARISQLHALSLTKVKKKYLRIGQTESCKP